MHERSASSASKKRRTGGRLERRPLLASCSAAAGFLGLAQAAFLVWRSEMFIEPYMVPGFLVLALITALATLLVLLPAIVMLRRLRPEWGGGDRLSATWAVTFALTAAVAAWMPVREWVSGPLVAVRWQPWAALLLVAVVGVAASWARPPRRWLAAGAVATPLLLLLALGLGAVMAPPRARASAADSKAAEPEPVRPAREGAPDVVLISVDTLRADRLGAYGAEPSLMPEVDRLASEGVVFERALAASPWTVPSVASMLTGVPAAAHGAGRPFNSGPTFLRSPLDDHWVTVAERFAAAGYRTRAVSANGFVSPDFGMAQGFEQFEGPFTTASLSAMLRELPLVGAALWFVPDEKLGDYRAQGVTDTALAWWDEQDERPLFLWAHYLDPHTPYQADPARLAPDALVEMTRQSQPPVLDDGTVVGEIFVATDLVRSGTVWLEAQDRLRLREYYDRAVRYADREIGRLLERIRAEGGDTIVAFTSDHGEELWEHGSFEHGHDYYREVIDVPLVFWGAGVPAGVRVTRTAGLVDVAPTLLALAGLDPPGGGSGGESDDDPGADPRGGGRSLVAEWSGGAVGEAAPARFAGNNLYNLPAALVEEGQWRFILRANDQAELYRLDQDPSERRNLELDEPEIAERFRRLLEPRLAALRTLGSEQGATELSPETIKALKALGYVD